MSGSLITEKALYHWIDNFYGYGSWEAPIWFINHEEPGGDMPEEVADKLNYFTQVHGDVTRPTLCDLRSMFKEVRYAPNRARTQVFDNLYDYRFGPNAVQRGEWKGIISFVHGYINRPINDDAHLQYQRNSLVTEENNEALIRLYPLPAHSHAWYYSWLDLKGMDFLKSRAIYQKQMYQPRINAILGNIRIYRPKVVVMFDMTGINMLKESVQAYFTETKFTSIKSIPHKLPQHHMARLDEQETTIILTTQSTGLRHNRKETGFNWGAFGRDLVAKMK